MAYMGQLYDSEFIEQDGFTDTHSTLVRGDTWSSGDVVKSGVGLYKLSHTDTTPILADGEYIYGTALRKAYFEAGKIYQYPVQVIDTDSGDTKDVNYFALSKNYPNWHNELIIGSDNSDFIIDGLRYLGNNFNSDGEMTYEYCDDSDKYYKCTLDVSDNDWSVSIDMYDCDDDSLIGERWSASGSSVLVIDDPTFEFVSKDMSSLLDVEPNTLLQFNTFNETRYYYIETLPTFVEVASTSWIGYINELLPFDGYYSRAFCTDYNATKKYYKVNVTKKSNSVILGNLIADKVSIKKYRDDELSETVEIVPDCYIDKDGILPKVSTTVFGKMELVAGDTLEVEFFGDNIVIGNIETSYMIDDGLTKYDFSSGYTNYNNRTEEFGEVELGTKPIVGRTSIKNIHNFEDGQILYLRYKEMQLHNVVYDPFDSFSTGLRSSWVIRAFLDSVTIKPLDNKNKFPEKLEIGLSVREIL